MWAGGGVGMCRALLLGMAGQDWWGRPTPKPVPFQCTCHTRTQTHVHYPPHNTHTHTQHTQVAHVDVLARYYISRQAYANAARVYELLAERRSGPGDASVALDARAQAYQAAVLQVRAFAFVVV